MMKILIFTEGTILQFGSATNLNREEIVTLSKTAGIQREENTLEYESNSTRAKPGPVYDFSSYIPIGNSVEKLKLWKKQGAEIYYLTSRRIKNEIDEIRTILRKYKFPDDKNLYFRHKGEKYKHIAERLLPDVLIEDDCESIGGIKEMTYPHLENEIKKKIKSVIVREFEGIDHLPHDANHL